MTELEEFMTGEGPYTPPALTVAVQDGYLETVKVYLNAILNSPLDSPAKEKLLTAKIIYGLSALQLAIDKEKMDVISVFADIVKNNDALHADEKGRLLKPYNDHMRENKLH